MSKKDTYKTLQLQTMNSESTSCFKALQHHYSRERSITEMQTSQEPDNFMIFKTMGSASTMTSKKYLIPETHVHLNGTFLYFDEKANKLSDMSSGKSRMLYKTLSRPEAITSTTTIQQETDSLNKRHLKLNLLRGFYNMGEGSDSQRTRNRSNFEIRTNLSSKLLNMWDLLI